MTTLIPLAVVYFVTAILSVSPSLSLSCPRYQKEALLQFKGLLVRELFPNQYLNSSSLVFPSWNLSSDCCKWDEVRCNLHHDVTDLDLVSIVHLSGSSVSSVSSKILSPLFQLITLRELDLSDNAIQGEIPSSGFGNLTELTSLNLSSNGFHGSFPKDLLLLRNLRVLKLFSNSFSGTLPHLFSNLSSLFWLDLSKNNFSGNIFPIIGPNSSVSLIDLSHNQFTGFHPQNLANLPTNLSYLHYLSFRDNKIIGEFPAFLCQFSSLEYLDLSNNFIEGSIHSDISNLGKLKGLDFSNNKLTGELPDSFWNITLNLKVLLLSNNNFSGSITVSLQNSVDLLAMDLSRNNFSGCVLPTFASSPNLIFIDLSYNRFSGPLPSSFGRYIRILSLGQNEFSGALPTALGNLSVLLHLDLRDNKLTGELPPSLFELTSLQVLDLSNNRIEGSIPRHVSNARNLKILDLSNNKLIGEIPCSMGILFAMIRLERDMPPFEYEAMHSVEDLLFFTVTAHVSLPKIMLANSITSYVLDLLLNWKRSKQSLSVQNIQLYALLDLSNNQLSGRIPASLGDLKILNSLNLSHNHLSRDIPNALGNLQSIEVLDLSHNDLSGEIPATFAKLQQLDTLDLSNNHLEGRIPTSPQLDRLNDPKIYANNSRICGMQIQVPCSGPPPPPQAQQKSPQESEREESIFSWEIAVVVFPISFIGTVVLVYSSGYFHCGASLPEKALATLLCGTNASILRRRKQHSGGRLRRA